MSKSKDSILVSPKETSIDTEKHIGITVDENSKSNMLKVLGKYFVFVPAFLFILGFFINNTYLSDLGVSDFDMWQIKYVNIGVFASFYALVTFILTIGGMDFKEFTNNFKWKNLIVGVYKNALLVTIYYYLLYNGKNAKVNILVYFVLLAILVICVSVYSKHKVWFHRERNRMSILFKAIFAVMIIMIVLTLSLIAISSNQALTNLVKVGIAVYITWALPLICYFPLEYVTNFQDRIFNNRFKLLGNRKTKILILLKMLLLFYGTLIIFRVYSLCVYPQIIRNCGGARPYHATIKVVESKLDLDKCYLEEGEVIDESLTWTILRLEGKDVYDKIKTDDIKEIITGPSESVRDCLKGRLIYK